jgi:predicted transcriptional regulator
MTAVEQLYTDIMKILSDRDAIKYGIRILEATNKARAEEKKQHMDTWFEAENSGSSEEVLHLFDNHYKKHIEHKTGK